MTRLFINSTDPNLANRIKPSVYEKILNKRKAARQALDAELTGTRLITLEIGSGHGHFLTTYAKEHRDETCIGIDVNKGRVYKALKKASRAKLENLHFFEIESMEFLNLLPAHVEIDKTWILYPDPWPKKRHFKNRIVQKHFLQKLASAVTKGGLILIRSDYEPYIEWSKELIETSCNWRLLTNYEWPKLPVTVFQELTNNQYFSTAAELKPAKQGHQKKLSRDGDAD